jgi:hypothetical protein
VASGLAPLDSPMSASARGRTAITNNGARPARTPSCHFTGEDNEATCVHGELVHLEVFSTLCAAAPPDLTVVTWPQ